MFMFIVFKMYCIALYCYRDVSVPEMFHKKNKSQRYRGRQIHTSLHLSCVACNRYPHTAAAAAAAMAELMSIDAIQFF